MAEFQEPAPLSRARVSLTWQDRQVVIRRWARTFAGGALSAEMARLNALSPVEP